MRSCFTARTGLALTLNPACAPAQSVPKDVALPQSEAPAAALQLANGARVKVVLAQTVSTRTAKPGDKVEFRVLNDVKAGPLILIAEAPRYPAQLSRCSLPGASGSPARCPSVRSRR
jgi:hypothetical protein